jgi:GNAT superfamily N-acetyltransferase
MVRELQPHEFTERLAPIFRHVEQEAGRTDGNGAYLFTQWRKWMEYGIARTWEDDGCVLGAIFAPHLFSGRVQAYVHFWFALPEARQTGRPMGIMQACIDAATAAGCEKVSSAAFETLNPEKTKRIYEKLGFSLSESIFTKRLV